MKTQNDKTILVVEDDAHTLLALEKRLMSQGYRVLVAGHWVAAMEHLQHGPVVPINLLTAQANFDSPVKTQNRPKNNPGDSTRGGGFTENGVLTGESTSPSWKETTERPKGA